MKFIGKIMLLISGIALLVTGIASLIPTIQLLIETGLIGENIPLWIFDVLANLFALFAGLAGISCLFIATNRRVNRVVGYASIFLVLMIIDIVFQVIHYVDLSYDVQEIFSSIWSYLVGSVFSIVYMLGALILKNSYKKVIE